MNSHQFSSFFLIPVLAIVLVFRFASAMASEKPLNIYLDADFSSHAESSISIERGLLTALANVDQKIQGRSVRILRMNHRGNSVRSKRNVRKFLADDNALMLVSGIHSPPLLANRDYINENGALFMVPWAAAGPITRPQGKKNWIFRLSVDDSKAGKFLMQYVVSEKNYKRPLLLLEDTGWGNSNYQTMTRALESLNIKKFDVVRFDWSLGSSFADAIVSDALVRQNDVVVLVANSLEGSVIVKAIAENSRAAGRLPVVSHWGITGGDFHTKVPHKTRSKVGLTFLQTRYSFLDSEQNPYQRRVFERAKTLFEEVNEPEDILAPTGFVHAHDLMEIVLVALKSFDLSGDIQKDRNSLRIALENTVGPVSGLLKTYESPFTPYTQAKPDSHEALDAGDFVVGQYGSKDEIFILQ